MDMTKASEALSSRVGAFDGLGDDRPDHVLFRGVLLIGDDDVVYVDDNLSRSLDGPGWSGDLLIFTPGRVIRLTLSQATEDAGRDPASSVEATSWGRAGLHAVDTLGADKAWDQTPEGLMPEGTGLRLTYADGKTIEVPSRWESGAGRATREALIALLPSLWEDLAAAT